MKTVAIALSALLLVSSPALFGGCICPGRSGYHLMVRGTAKAGEPTEVRLRVFITERPWPVFSGMCGAPVSGRYRNVRLYYRLAGEIDWKVLEPSAVIPGQDKWEEYHEFVIPPYPKGTSGEIEVGFAFEFGGRQVETPQRGIALKG